MVPADAKLVLVPHGRAARDVLFTLIANAQREDRLEPVTVAVPSPYAGLSLRRALGRDRGLVNVRFLALARVAELLGAPYLAEPDRRPLTPAIALGAVHAALAEDPGELGPVASHPATARSLHATFTDLRALDEAELDRLAGTADRARTVVRLYRRVRELTAGYYDDDDQLLAAAAVVRAGGSALADIGTLIVHLPRSLTPAGLEFVGAFAATGRAAAVLGLTGDDSVDAATRDLATRLAPTLGPPQEVSSAPAPVGSAVVSCPDADEEVRTVIRAVLERAGNGTPLHRIAVAYRLDQPYALLLHEHFAAAGIPVHGPSTRRLADTAAGRTLLGLLALPDTAFRRDVLMEALTAAPVLENAGGKPVPGPRWDRLSCAANVVGGLEQWRQRLERHAQHRSERLTKLAADAGTLFATDETDHVIDDCNRLTKFVEELAINLQPASSSTWGELSQWARGLLDRYVGRRLRAGAPDGEQVALERVQAVVEGLAALDDLGQAPSIAALRDALEESLDVRVGHAGSFGDGVLVAPLNALLATDYDALFVLGATEGTFPPRSQDDPVLPDVEREVLDGVLPRRVERRVAERAVFLSALACAEWRALTLPRADTRAQRATRPAAWLLETASHHEGRLVGAQDLDPGTMAAKSAVASGWLQIVQSFDHAVRDSDEPASLQEHDVQSLLRWPGSPLRHPLVRSEPALATGLRAVRSRSGRRLDAFDGVIDPDLVVPPGIDAALSPTALETWAGCPFRYLLREILHVRAVERPEARDRITGRDRGTLIHAVLDEFLREHPRTHSGQRWSAAERQTLREIAETECDKVERDGITGRPVLWKLDRARIVREVERVLDTDEVIREERGLVPESFEVGFGHADDEFPPVRFDLSDDKAVIFRGRIDRVDRSESGGIEIFDYKTGFAKVDDDDLQADPVQGGTSLQLPIYAMAMRQAKGGGGPVRASYWFTRNAGVDALAGFELDESSEERVHDVLDLLADEIIAGHFPAYPGKERYRLPPMNCDWCDFDRLCPKDRVRRFERRRQELIFDGILSLREPDDERFHEDDADDLEAEIEVSE